MTAWLREGEKFALVGLQVETDGGLADGPISESLEAYTSIKLDMPGHWREWLGTLSIEEIERCTLLLVSRQRSGSPGVVDGESQVLARRVGLWHTGLMLACPLHTWEDPITAGGSLYDGALEVREFSTLHRTHDSTISAKCAVTVEHLVDATRLASTIQGLVTVPGAGVWRLMRCLQLYQEARKLADPMERIHQFARCVEGLLATTSGSSKARFKSRTELFIGPKHHDTMGTIYDIRSEVEHLHEDLRLNPFDRDKRLEIAKMEIVAAELARNVLLRIFGDQALALKMGSREDLEAFWNLDPEERQAAWGRTYDLMAPLAGVCEDHISDEELGRQQF